MFNSEVCRKMRISFKKMTVMSVIALLLAGCAQTKEVEIPVVNTVVEETTMDEETVEEKQADESDEKFCFQIMERKRKMNLNLKKQLIIISHK